MEIRLFKNWKNISLHIVICVSYFPSVWCFGRHCGCVVSIFASSAVLSEEFGAAFQIMFTFNCVKGFTLAFTLEIICTFLWTSGWTNEWVSERMNEWKTERVALLMILMRICFLFTISLLVVFRSFFSRSGSPFPFPFGTKLYFLLFCSERYILSSAAHVSLII